MGPQLGSSDASHDLKPAATAPIIWFTVEYRVIFIGGVEEWRRGDIFISFVKITLVNQEKLSKQLSFMELWQNVVCLLLKRTSVHSQFLQSQLQKCHLRNDYVNH